MKGKKLTWEQKKAKSILENIKRWFGIKDKQIYKIRVISGTQKFWVKNPQKIEFWKGFAEKQALVSLKESSFCFVRITQVIHK